MAARCQIELQKPDETSTFQDPSSMLDAVLGENVVHRDLVRRVLLQLGLNVQLVETDAIDTRVHDELPVRLILESTRIAVTFDLPKGRGDDLPAVLDAVFELCFAVARELSLDVYDPQTDQIISENRYERQFSLLLDGYTRRQRIAEALGRLDEWTELPEASVDPAIRDQAVDAPMLSVPRDVLPSRRRALRGRFGPLEIMGESAGKALTEALAQGSILALVSNDEIDVYAGRDATLARVVRYYKLRRGEWLVEFQALGRRSVEAVRPMAGALVKWVTVSPAMRST